MTATNTKSKNTFKSFKPKKRLMLKPDGMQGLDIPALAVCFLLALASGRRTVGDFPLACLTLVLTASAQDIMEKAVFSAGGVLSLALMCIGDRRFLPYLLGQIVYIARFSALQKKEVILATAIVIMAVCRILLTNSGIYSVLEAVAVWGLVYAVEQGRQIYHSKNQNFTDVIYLLISCLAVIFALTGFDTRLVYVSCAGGLALSWLWVAKGENVYGLLGLICFFVALSDKQGFTALFVSSCLIWIIGAVCSEKVSYIIYPATIFTAFMANLVFLPELMGFSLTGTVIFALGLYTVLPYILRFNPPKAPQLFSGEKDRRDLQLGMKKLEESLNFLGSCAIDISKLNEKNMSPQLLEDMVAEDVCRKCHKSSYCWQEKYSFTAGQFAKYRRNMNYADRSGFDSGFYSQCTQPDRVKASFEENSRLELSRRYIVQSQKNNQKLLQSAFMSISATVGEMLHKNSTSRLVNSAFTMGLDRFLQDLGINHSYCLAMQNPDKANFCAREPVKESDLYKIKAKLENLYGVNFGIWQAEEVAGEISYSFMAVPRLGYEIATENRPLGQVNGDSRLWLEVSGKLFVLLSDGMGTGASRAAESRTVIAMAQSLLNRGVSALRMINIVNLALNLRGGESGASLEVLEVDLYTGKARLIKAGAGVSLVFGKNDFARYYRDSLPLGVLKDVKLAVEEFTLKNQDTVLLISDGVGNVSGNIRNLYDKPPQDVAKFAVNENKLPDDKLAVAVRISANTQ